MPENRTVNLSKEKGAVVDDGKIVVFTLGNGYVLVFTREELENLEKFRAVGL